MAMRAHRWLLATQCRSGLPNPLIKEILVRVARGLSLPLWKHGFNSCPWVFRGQGTGVWDLLRRALGCRWYCALSGVVMVMWRALRRGRRGYVMSCAQRRTQRHISRWTSQCALQ